MATTWRLIAAAVAGTLPFAGLAAAAEAPDQAAAVLAVGPHRALTTPSAAAAVAVSGQVVEIDAAVYEGDVAVWRQDRLTIRGVGGRPLLRAAGRAAERKGIWVIYGRDVRIENVAFAEATVADRNGAGIRHQGGNLTVVGCLFRDNEDGILTHGDPTVEITVERSEFARNGYSDGQAHGIYVGPVKQFTAIGNYFHGSRVGHLVKSRAAVNQIAYNRITDEADGASSYNVDLPNGGIGVLLGNLLQQGPRTQNPAMVAFGAEGLRHPENRLEVVNNTFVNGLGRGEFVKVFAGEARLINNIFVGGGSVLHGQGSVRNNLLASWDGAAPSFDHGGVDAGGNRRSPAPRLRDARRFDYRLAVGSPAAGGGVDPLVATGMAALRPVLEYVHPLQLRPRRAGPPFDIGAFAAPP